MGDIELALNSAVATLQEARSTNPYSGLIPKWCANPETGPHHDRCPLPESSAGFRLESAPEHSPGTARSPGLLKLASFEDLVRELKLRLPAARLTLEV